MKLHEGARMPRPGVVMTGLAGYDEPLPCGTDSARRRHLVQGRVCDVCGVPEGPPFVAGAA